MSIDLPESVARADRPTTDLTRVVNPRSVVVVGASQKAGSPTEAIVKNLRSHKYAGEIHLVGRNTGELNGQPILTWEDDLPDGVDLALIIVPASGVVDAIYELGQRDIGAAVCFASGFAEMGEAGAVLQDDIARAAAEAEVRLIGPNSVGFFNYADSFHVTVVDMGQLPSMDRDLGPGIGVVAQSGGIGAALAASLNERGIPVPYSFTTGNEVDLGAADFVNFMADDPLVGAMVVYAEQIRNPREFLAATRRARTRGKHVAILHSGRTEAASAATQSHTGALTGDFQAMHTTLTYSGVAVADSMEELVDLGELLLRYPEPTVGGQGLMTTSGALGALAQDYCEPLGVQLPPLTDHTVAALREELPPFLPPGNPLDVGTAIGPRPELVGIGMRALLADPAIGSVVLSHSVAGPEMSMTFLREVVESVSTSKKPVIYVLLAEDRAFWPECLELAKREGIILKRSPERAFRALAALERYWKSATAQRAERDRSPSPSLVDPSSGAIPEWRGKRLLADLEVPVPDGGLATTADDAVAIATRIGYPVVAKAQAPTLTHKTEHGAVILGITNDHELRDAVESLHRNIVRTDPDITLDGILIESMAGSGVELVVGARRDPQWGPVVMVGLGGIWIEVLHDVRLLPTNLTTEEIVAQLGELKAAALLQGARGNGPVNLRAIAEVVSAVGAFIDEHPEVSEVDINPLVAYDTGVVALDALIVLDGA